MKKEVRSTRKDPAILMISSPETAPMIETADPAKFVRRRITEQKTIPPHFLSSPIPSLIAVRPTTSRREIEINKTMIKITPVKIAKIIFNLKG